MSKTVYIIHGWTYNLNKWTELSHELEKRGVQAILLKVPGLTEPSDKVWDINGYVAWLDGKLKNVDKPIVIGHSNGGRIALSYIQKHPNRIKQLILIDSAGIAHNEKKAKAKLKTLRGLAKVAKPLGRIPPLKKGFYKVIGARDYYDAPPNMKFTMQNMLHADQLLDLGSIQLPVTIIWGRDDTITPLKDGQKMHGLIKNSSLHIVDDARHAPQAAFPTKVATIIEQAIKAS